jgi:hypothetical protein
MTDFHRLLNLLAEHEVEFIIIGGVAAVVHGSSRRLCVKFWWVE